MAVTEAAKHDLYTYLQQTMGEERADTLMAMVSPTGWEDVATKHDLVLLRTEMTAEFKQVRTELAGLRAEFKGEMSQFVTKDYLENALRTQLMATLGFFSVFSSIALVVARLMA